LRIKLDFATSPVGRCSPSPSDGHLHRWPNTARAAYSMGSSPSARACQAGTRICQHEAEGMSCMIPPRYLYQVKRQPNEPLRGTSYSNFFSFWTLRTMLSHVEPFRSVPDCIDSGIVLSQLSHSPQLVEPGSLLMFLDRTYECYSGKRMSKCSGPSCYLCSWGSRSVPCQWGSRSMPVGVKKRGSGGREACQWGSRSVPVGIEKRASGGRETCQWGSRKGAFAVKIEKRTSTRLS